MIKQFGKTAQNEVYFAILYSTRCIGEDSLNQRCSIIIPYIQITVLKTNIYIFIVN